jgi:hypothetical protein
VGGSGGDLAVASRRHFPSPALPRGRPSGVCDLQCKRRWRRRRRRELRRPRPCWASWDFLPEGDGWQGPGMWRRGPGLGRAAGAERRRRRRRPSGAAGGRVGDAAATREREREREREHFSRQVMTHGRLAPPRDAVQLRQASQDIRAAGPGRPGGWMPVPRFPVISACVSRRPSPPFASSAVPLPARARLEGALGGGARISETA